MDTKKPAPSWCVIVVPCYNESGRIQTGQFLHFINHQDNIRLLFVNDGSKDYTIRILNGMHESVPDLIQVLDLKQNVGKAEAVRAGMLAAIQSDDVASIGFWDADLATPLDTIPEFLTRLAVNTRLDMVFGSRVRLLGHQVQRRAVRHYLGRVFASVVSVVLRLPVYDTQCGAKLFRVTPGLAHVLKDKFHSRWVFDVEILARYIALHRGNTSYLYESVYEHPLHSWEDVAGSKVSPSDFFKAFFEVLLIYRKYLWHRDKV